MVKLVEIRKRLELAKKELRRSVIEINPEINDKELPDDVLFFGIKILIKFQNEY